MKTWLSKWLSPSPVPATTVSAPGANNLTTPPLAFRADTKFPIVDWEAMDIHQPVTTDAKVLDAFWTAVAKQWLKALGKSFGGQYSVAESDRFLLLSTLPERKARAVLDFVEKSQRRILLVLQGIAASSESGKVCLLIVDDQETYYNYVSHYYPEDGEFSLSGGMFLQHGYGHLVFVTGEFNAIEPVIAHELTHCLVQHLPLPAWLNEGIAVNTEYRVTRAPAPLYTPEEMHHKHMDYWNPSTIQEFWSGKSWHKPGDSNLLSYDLAQHFVRMAAQDFDSFRKFANAAHLDDSGDKAARAHLGYPLAHFAEAILGEGSWQPDPASWNDGVEQGRF